jgi:DegV family protein with EDD domain
MAADASMGDTMSVDTHRIALITDSTADIPPELLERYGILVLPLYVLWGEETYRDGVDISKAAFYERIARETEPPKTSQPTPMDFVRLIRACHCQEALIIPLSGALSGTVNAAMQAAQMVDIPVHVEDSRAISMALGWQVLAAARAREAGGVLEDMVAAARAARAAQRALFTVDTLEYLHRGGRIGGAAAFLGTVLQLKPVLRMDTTTGRVEAVERCRTRRKALKRICEIAFEGLDDSRPIRVAVLHAAAPDDMQILLDHVLARCTPTEWYTGDLTTVIGTHGGPGLVGMCLYSD